MKDGRMRSRKKRLRSPRKVNKVAQFTISSFNTLKDLRSRHQLTGTSFKQDNFQTNFMQLNYSNLNLSSPTRQW